ncbi:putative cupin 2 domain-containing protein [Rosellinia necatrix]|uniref:Putative cupin 2 domain-containing protein n=1 Tax=Rosellinia necatrix TaxID=77044 RepID=A0A1W2TX36_ROSNE|nr:putative cupin 2 domain-containing protein [Rosellinia necatrix]
MSSSTAPISSPSYATTNPRVFVTKHDAAGNAVFADEEGEGEGEGEEVPLFRPMGPAGSSFAVFDTRGAVPVDNAEGARAVPDAIPRCPPGGVNFCVSNIAPRFAVPMHRTLSLDYAVVLSGEIALRLEGGAERVVRAGEFVVQGGVAHAWVNRADEPCRIAFVTVGARKVARPDGSELDEIAPAVRQPAA